MHDVGLHSGYSFYFVYDRIRDIRIIQLEVKNRSLAAIASDFLKGRQWQKLSRAFAMFHNSSNTKGVVQDVKIIPNFDVFAVRKKIVDQNIIRLFKRPAFEITK